MTGLYLRHGWSDAFGVEGSRAALAEQHLALALAADHAGPLTGGLVDTLETVPVVSVVSNWPASAHGAQIQRWTDGPDVRKRLF